MKIIPNFLEENNACVTEYGYDKRVFKNHGVVPRNINTLVLLGTESIQRFRAYFFMR